MSNTGYDLNDMHKVRYWLSEESLTSLLKGIRKFVKENEVSVDSISIASRYDDELEEIVYEASAIYLGVAN